MVIAYALGGARAVARCNEIGVAPYSDTENGLYRGYLTPAHQATIDRVGAWMVEAGMRVEIDAAANLIGRYDGSKPDTPPLIIGSHIDSVRDAGRYDGPLGVMLGIECVDALNRAGRRLSFAVEVYAFGDEEGSRFPAAMLTSRAVAGTLSHAALDLKDSEGMSLAEAGIDVAAYLRAAREPGSVLAYLEAHIEQGPVLEAEGLAIGTVTGIAAQLRYQIILTGTAGHAGTTSMQLRRDALAGAAEIMLAIETIARDDASDLVATVGKIETLPGAANVIPGEVRFTLDVRAGDAAQRDLAADAMIDQIQKISEARGLEFRIEQIHDLPSSPCDPVLMALLDDAIADTGQSVRRLVSGAGHDAMAMAALCPTAMLFIRCKDGISHNPAEHVEPADAEVALRVMLGFIEGLERQLGGRLAI